MFLHLALCTLIVAAASLLHHRNLLNGKVLKPTKKSLESTFDSFQKSPDATVKVVQQMYGEDF
jgi:hypothetical protein